jgi:multidrug efflux pump subunit AcrA (membrane-fusion protein)
VALTDVEQVRVGQPARLRLSAYRSRDVPLIEGEVIYVSADRQVDEQGNAYFLARLGFDPAPLEAHAPGLTPAAGMPVEAYLLGERRSALDYLVRPLRVSLRRSLRD